ncbi:MAG: energy transducer TonB [Bacteroidota bacterium]
MILDKLKYSFLGRMRRPEGLSPVVDRDRNVDLGASPNVIFEASLAVSLVCCILTFLLFPSVERSTVAANTSQEFVTFEDIEHTRQENRPPPPPRPPIPIEAPSDEEIEDVDLASSEINVAEDIAPPPPANNSEEEEYFVAVEEMPEPIGGMVAIHNNLIYPEIARRAGIQGRVYVLAFVNDKGEVTKTEVIKGIGAGCDEAAMAAVRKARFIPGRQRGKPVKVRISIPIRFQLTTD